MVLRPVLLVVVSLSGGLAASKGKPAKPGKAVAAPAIVPPADARFNIIDAETGRTGLIDGEGKVIVKPRYQGCMDFTEGLAACGRDERFYYLDPSGKEVIDVVAGAGDMTVTWYGTFGSGLAPIYGPNEKVAYFIDRTGKIVLRGETVGFDHAESFEDGVAVAIPAADHRMRGYIDPTGAWVIAPRFRSAKAFSEGVASVRTRDGTWGVIDKKGAWVIPAKHRYPPSPASDGLLGVYDPGAGAYLVFDVKGKERFRVPGFFELEEEQRPFRCKHQRCPVWLDNGKAGFVDYKGKRIIPAEFAAVGSFHEGVAWAKKDDRVGYIRPDGSWALPPTYLRAHDFVNGLAAVRWPIEGATRSAEESFHTGYIDHAGKVVWQTTHGAPRSSAPVQ